MHVSAHIRAFQSRFPALLEAKANAQRLMRRALRQPFEADFALLEHWAPEPGEVFIDVGANRGQSIDAIRLYHPDALIHAFEPNAHLAANLSRLFARDGALAIYACGLGERDETHTLHIPVYRGFVYDGLASFDAAECASWLNADTVAGFDPEQLKVISFEARAFPLDDLDLNPGFIKLDVQGFERSVLAGARNTLERCSPLVLLENNAEADAFLTQSLGWTRAAWTGSRLKPGCQGELNTLYIAPARVTSLVRAGLLG
jgi:FkbM family methyltransferase